MTYSLEFRLYVLNFKNEHGLTFEETSAHFNLSIRSLFRWNKEIEPCKHRNKPPTKIDTQKLMDDIERYPNAYQYERAKRFGVSKSGIGYALKRLKRSSKKDSKKSTKKTTKRAARL